MEISNNINFSNPTIINGSYKFNNVPSQQSSQLVSNNDTLFSFELPANWNAANLWLTRLEFNATTTAPGVNNTNILLSSVSPVSRIEVKTASGMTIANMSRAAAFSRLLPDRLKKSDTSLSSATNGRF